MKFDVFPKVYVSILVLMDLCIKTKIFTGLIKRDASFNPCFNGSMYKNSSHIVVGVVIPVFQSLF